MSENHCKDCCCAKSWAALGVSEYDGKSIPEHITQLRAEVERLKQKLNRPIGYGESVTAALEQYKQQRDTWKADAERLAAAGNALADDTDCAEAHTNFCAALAAHDELVKQHEPR